MISFGYGITRASVWTRPLTIYSSDKNIGDSMGRPTKYIDDMPERVIALMSQGASLVEVAADLGVSRATLSKWQDDDEKPGFVEAIKSGIELSEAWWMREGREALRDRQFNHGLWYMNMKNRFGWSDKQQVEHSGETGFIRIIMPNGD